MATTADRSALARVAEWAQAEPGVTVFPDGTLLVAGDTPLTVTVTTDDERIQLTHHHLETAVAAGRAESVRANLPGRGSVVSGTVATAGLSLEVTLTATIYTDGLTRQAFVASLNELIAATDRTVGGVPSAAAPQAAVTTAAPPAAAPPAAAADPQPAPAAAPDSPAPADTTPTMVVSQVWAPTHRVPQGGLRAWPKPDSAVEPITTLQARVELSIVERRADWARVVGSNGWTGWVDARRLEPITTGVTPSGGATFPLGLFGAVAVVAAAFLPWFKVGDFTADGFDVALEFLWKVDAAGDPPLGWLVAGLGALGAIAILFRGVPDGMRRLAGIGAIAAAALFTLQVQRGLDVPWGDVVDALGYGVYVALAGGVVLLLAPRARASKA